MNVPRLWEPSREFNNWRSFFCSQPFWLHAPQATERVAPGIDQTIPGATKWGHYDGEPVTKWNPDGRTMTLLTELRYTDPHGEVWVAPVGSLVDGASIPRYLWSVMGGPFEGKYRNASVLHDVAYGQRKRPWQDCDRMFYYAMRCSGVGATEVQDHVLRSLQIRASLEVSHQTRQTGEI